MMKTAFKLFQNSRLIKKNFVCYAFLASFFWVKGVVAEGEEPISQEDYETTFAMDLKAADEGDAESQLKVAWRYFKGGREIAKDCVEAVKYFELAAQQEHRNALYLLGNSLLAGGDCFVRNTDRAIDLIQRAASLGNVYANNALGNFYLGTPKIGIERDDDLAQKYYKAASSLGDATSSLQLGMLYAKGRFKDKDEKGEKYYYTLAAEQGSKLAARFLGKNYDTGKVGYGRDEVLAAKYYQKAADQGDEQVYARLAHFYRTGIGVDENWTKAGDLFLKCAELDKTICQVNFGLMNFSRRYEEADELIGYKWLRIAELKGSEDGEKILTRLRNKASQNFLEKGDKLAQEWLREKDQKQ